MSVTWNPSDKGANITLSNNNLTATLTSATYHGVRATHSKSSGKHYFEVALTVKGNVDNFGVAPTSYNVNTQLGEKTGTSCYDARGYTYLNNTYNYNGVGAITGDVIGIAIDIDLGKIWFAKNNVWMNSGDPANGTNSTYTNAVLQNTVLFPAMSLDTVNSKSTARFKADDFSYTPPTGFSAWELPQIEVPQPRLIQTLQPHNSHTIARLGL